MDGKCREHNLPLKVVLGTLSNGLNEQKPQPDHAATYILGTSYYDYSRGIIIDNKYKKLNKDGRVPMEDRKGTFEHFRPRNLVLSTIRVTSVTISNTFSTYFTDQLLSEQRMDELVDSGKLTPHEADELNEEWEEREWKLRMDALPRRIWLSLLRYHAITALMRFYEHFLDRYILKIDLSVKSSGSMANTETVKSHGLSHEQAVSVMDKLTRDPYLASLRTSQLLYQQEHAPGKVLSTNGVETSTRRELMSRMFSTCLWANAIPFLAELTVQQGVLFYGYGMYYMEKKRKRKERQEQMQQNEENVLGNKSEGDECIAESKSAYALSILLKSSYIAISRGMGWVAASAGGAIGTIIWPGWGAVCGISCGDSIIGLLTN